MPHTYSHQDAYTLVAHDVIVCTDSHTRFSGSKTERIPAGTRVAIDEARDGTKWYTWGETVPNSLGYPQHLYRGKLVRYEYNYSSSISDNTSESSSRGNRERESVNQCERHGDGEDLYGIIPI